MLNYNEIKIVNAVQDKEKLEHLNVVPEAIIKAVIMAKEEIKNLEDTLNNSFENEESFENLYKRLKGEDGLFDAEYPDYNRFNLSYGSLYLTVEQPTDKTNNMLKSQIRKEEISIYPDNICDMMGEDSLFTLDFTEEIDFEKINDYLMTQGDKKVQHLLKEFFKAFDLLKENNIDRINYKESIYNNSAWLDKDINKYDYSDLLGCMLDMEDECNEFIRFSSNMLQEINQFKKIYIEPIIQRQEECNEENEEEME